MKKLILIFFSICLLSGCISNQNNSTEIQIHDIQGCTHNSPYTGQKVKSIEGVVTHKFSNGFSMQSTLPDELDCSSEGIFIFTEEYSDVQIGNLLRVSGIVNEFFEGETEDHNLSRTEIINPQISIVKEKFPLPEPILLDNQSGNHPNRIIENDSFSTFDIDEDGIDFYESLEFMLVEIKNAVVVDSINSYNEVIVLPLDQITENIVSSQGVLLSTNQDQNPERIMLKFSSSFNQNVEIGSANDAPIIGVMGYSFGNYKLYTTADISFSNEDYKDFGFTSTGDGLTIATYNLENYSRFDSLKKTKTIAKQIINDLDSPDIIVLNEIEDDSGTENDGTTSSEKNILSIINSITDKGGPEYSYSDNPPENNQDGGIEGGNIRSVLLFRSDRNINLVKPDSQVDGIKFNNEQFQINENPYRIGISDEIYIGTRKPAIWLLEQNGIQFFIFGIHLTSQGANDPDWGNQQPPAKPEELKRINQVMIINDTVESILNKNSDANIILAGDFNDSAWSKSISIISKKHLFDTSMVEEPEERFSFIFEGNAMQYDYVFVSSNLSSSIVSTKNIHINTILSYEDRISDHDPIVTEVIISKHQGD